MFAGALKEYYKLDSYVPYYFTFNNRAISRDMREYFGENAARRDSFYTATEKDRRVESCFVSDNAHAKYFEYFKESLDYATDILLKYIENNGSEFNITSRNRTYKDVSYKLQFAIFDKLRWDITKCYYKDPDCDIFPNGWKAFSENWVKVSFVNNSSFCDYYGDKIGVQYNRIVIPKNRVRFLSELSYYETADGKISLR